MRIVVQAGPASLMGLRLRILSLRRIPTKRSAAFVSCKNDCRDSAVKPMETLTCDRGGEFGMWLQ